MKIIHTADWHFCERDHDEIMKCVMFMLNHPETQDADLFCVSGDLTDSKNLNLDSRSARSIFQIINRMLDIAPVAVVIGTPSHDGKASLILRECYGKYPILVSDRPEQMGYYEDMRAWGDVDSVRVAIPKFIVTQIPQPSKQFFVNELSIEDTDKAIAVAMSSIFANFAAQQGIMPHIVNGHGQISGAFISETQQLIGRDIEISKDQLLSTDADIICYGHIHKAQDMGDNIFYAGSPTRMNFGETEEKGFFCHTVGVVNESIFIKTPARLMISIKEDFTCDEDIMSFVEYLDSLEMMPTDLYQGNYVKITLKIWQDEAEQMNKNKLETLFLAAGAEKIIVSIVRVPRETVRAEKVLEAEKLRDKLTAMAELRGETVLGSILEKADRIEASESEPWK